MLHVRVGQWDEGGAPSSLESPPRCTVQTGLHRDSRRAGGSRRTIIREWPGTLRPLVTLRY